MKVKKQGTQAPELEISGCISSSLYRLASAIRVENRRCSVLSFVAVFALMILSAINTHAHSVIAQAPDGATIRGTVVDPANKVVIGATVRLEQQGVVGSVETKTNSAGAFAFLGLRAGSYKLTAEKMGLSSRAVTVDASTQGDQKEIDLTLQEARAALSSAQPAMEFADKPNFTVAGVTDWTAVGGHGSDAILRTSETLARETLTLKPEGVTSSNTANAPNAANNDSEYGLALACKQAGDLKKAREHLQNLLAVKESSDARRLAGEVDEQLGDPLAAVHEFEQAARLDPSERNYFEWGSELLLHRAVWQARDVFVKGVEAYPKSARMMTALGAALFAGARYDEAALRLCDASDLNPADPEPYAFIGKVELVAPTPLPCVEQKLARFAQQQPNNSQANYLYAMAIWKRQQQPADQGALRQVETLLTKSVTIDPKCGDAYLQLGILSSSQRNVEKAIEFYMKAIEANPQLGEAHYRLGVAYDRRGEAAKAKQEFQLHDEIEKQQADAIESQRREVKQFLVVLQGQTAVPPAR
jgi:tetratricopeptide (TPR) repeat protein